MKVEYVNPFVQATVDVLQGIGDVSPKKGSLKMLNKPAPSYGVSSLIGVVGEVKGQVVYSLKEETAKKIASVMMMGMPVDDFDEIAKSAISELSNMITGNAVTQLVATGVNVDISPPSLITGNNVVISSSSLKTLVVDIETIHGTIEISLALE